MMKSSLSWIRWTRSGHEGVAKELEEMGYAKETVENYLQLFQEVASDVTGIRYLKEKLGDCLEVKRQQTVLEMIISSVETAKECEFKYQIRPDTCKRTCLITQERSLK